MKTTIKVIGLLSCTFLIGGCATYVLSTESLLEQFAYVHPDKKITVGLAYPIYFYGEVTGNDLQQIKCFDKNGIERKIKITTHTGIRITKKDSSRTTFYFNTLLIKDSIIVGSKSHFAELHIKPINLNDIDLIEIQN